MQILPKKTADTPNESLSNLVKPPVEQLRAVGITKTYGKVIANDDIDFTIHQGEIKALLGENGAGKSTLVKILGGITKPDAGEIFWQGSLIDITNPKDAKNLGIGMVFQHFLLFEGLSVLDNIALSIADSYHKPTLLAKIRQISNNYGLPVDPEQLVSNLSVGAKQRIEIIRCLLQNPRLLILDEPTAVLTPQEAEKLFVTLQRLASEGCAILYISHRLEEVRQICNTATVMRAGKIVDEIIPAEKTSKDIAESMLGAQILTPKRNPNQSFEQVRLQVNNLNLSPKNSNNSISRTGLKNINFSLYKGEIIAIAGIAGNGQNDLMSVLSGEITYNDANIIILDNKGIADNGIAARRELGMGVSYVPEERLGHGAVAEMTLAENVLLTSTKNQKLINFGWINQTKVFAFAREIIDKFKVRSDGYQSLASELSGGNLQKFIVGREMAQQPKVILAAQPTWGVDAGAASQIQQTLLDLTEKGCSVILISQDLDEIFTIANRISIMFEGNLSDFYPTSDISLHEIGLLMVGESIPDKPKTIENSLQINLDLGSGN